MRVIYLRDKGKTYGTTAKVVTSQTDTAKVNDIFDILRLKVDGTSFQVFWICKLWKERRKSQLSVITKFVYDSIAKLVLVQKRQLFCHQLLPWQRPLMIVQTYFWASKAHILKTNLVTPNFFHISFFVIWKWNYMFVLKTFYEADFL